METIVGYVGKPEPLYEEPVIVDAEATVVEEAPKAEEKPKAKRSTKK